MTGYNHYPSCTCGWCTGGWRGRLAPGASATYLAGLDAQRLLGEHHVRGVQSCFVNPNANCPVCRAPVFYYANDRGSRVYFDDLGPPWPKHPCTDQPKTRIAEYVPAKKRPLGLITDLKAAAHRLEMFKTATVGMRPELEWSLLVIVALTRKGEKNSIRAEFLNSANHECIDVVCYSASAIFEVGEFLSTRGGQFSYFARHIMQEVRFGDGEFAKIFRAKSHGQPSENKQDHPTQPVSDRIPEAKSPYYRAVIDCVPEDVRQHFLPRRGHVDAFMKRMYRIIQAYTKLGVRRPGDVAGRLNLDKHVTAHGSKWTPKLTGLLLKILFRPEEGRDGPNRKRQDRA